MKNSAFGSPPLVVKKSENIRRRVGEDGGREAPHVHRDGLVACQTPRGLPLDIAHGALSFFLYFRDLLEVGQVALGVDDTDAARHGAMLGERVAQDESDHRVIA